MKVFSEYCRHRDIFYRSIMHAVTFRIRYNLNTPQWMN